MAATTLLDLASRGDIASLKAAGRAHAARIRMAVQNVDENARAVIEGRCAIVLTILDQTSDPVMAAAAVKELEQAPSEVDRMLSQVPKRTVKAPKMSQVVGTAGMGSPPEGDELEQIRSQNRAALGMGAPFSAAGIAQNFLGAAVKGVTLKTTVTPEMRYDPGLPGQPAQVTK